MMINKLALGTVQFGLDYGINNTRGKIPFREIENILNFALSNKILMLDTAFSYGESENVLGEFFKTNPKAKKGFKIVSKLPSIRKQENQNPAFFFEESLSRLGLESIYGYILHNYDDIKVFPQVSDFFKRIKSQGRVKKIGYSLYFPEQLKEILDEDLPCDLVQVPYNVFDRRFERLFPELKKRKIEMHSRSVFLQGLFFKETSNLFGNLKNIAPKIEKLRKLSVENDIRISEICLCFALSNSHIKHVLCGIDSLDNLRENVSALDVLGKFKKIKKELNSLVETDEGILNPSQWRLK
jgi:uncharacterized protein